MKWQFADMKNRTRLLQCWLIEEQTWQMKLTEVIYEVVHMSAKLTTWSEGRTDSPLSKNISRL